MSPSSPGVPPLYQGLWRRTGIRRSNGAVDPDKQVWWFQSARFHIDLRLPLARPRPARHADVARLAPRDVQGFGAPTGFAGHTVVAAARCDWLPEIAFPLLGGDTDAGLMRFDTPDNLHESAIDASYEEDWLRVATGPVLGLRLESLHEAGAVAYLLVGGDWAAWALGRAADAFPSTPAWAEFSLLHKDRGAWRVRASNCPWLEGGPLFDADALERAALSRLAPGATVILRQAWRVAEVDAPGA